MVTNKCLSLIIPIYNTEKYLEECVESIISQIDDRCEIILVDDGSTDSSAKICDNYAATYESIKVIHKDNGGLSSARNAGLIKAKGRYVTFVDSDDRIIKGSIETILRWIDDNERDVCFLKSIKIYPDGKKEDMNEMIEGESLSTVSKEKAVFYLSSRPKYPGSAWAKLFRKSFLIDNDLHFPYDRRFSEDLGFIRDCILKAESFDAIDVLFYEYRQNREGSITNKISTKNFIDLSLFITESCQQLTTSKIPNDLISKYVMSFVAYEYSILLMLLEYVRKEDEAAAIDMLIAYKWVLKYGKVIKLRLIYLLINVIGLRFTSRLINIYRKCTL